MRFHCGVSFSWRTIKKFLIPFLLGVLSFFGFNFINDKFNLGFIKVNALEDNEVIENDNFTDSNNNGIDDEIDDNYYYWSSILSSDNLTEHKGLFNKIYWFDDNTTEIGVLTSIYEVLFLYCFTMICFRILTFIKNIRW